MWDLPFLLRSAGDRLSTMDLIDLDPLHLGDLLAVLFGECEDFNYSIIGRSKPPSGYYDRREFFVRQNPIPSSNAPVGRNALARREVDDSLAHALLKEGLQRLEHAMAGILASIGYLRD